jgi:hypothetical protein
LPSEPVIIPPLGPGGGLPPIDPGAIIPPLGPGGGVPPIDPGDIIPPLGPGGVRPPLDPGDIIPLLGPPDVLPRPDLSDLLPPVVLRVEPPGLLERVLPTGRIEDLPRAVADPTDLPPAPPGPVDVMPLPTVDVPPPAAAPPALPATPASQSHDAYTSDVLRMTHSPRPATGSSNDGPPLVALSVPATAATVATTVVVLITGAAATASGGLGPFSTSRSPPEKGHSSSAFDGAIDVLNFVTHFFSRKLAEAFASLSPLAIAPAPPPP